MQKVMENTYKMSVPIRVDPEVGNDWGHVEGRTLKKKKIVGGKEVVVKKTLSMGEFLERAVKKFTKGEASAA
jgi:hypothetical protein